MSEVMNLRFGVCNVCLKSICQCPKPTPHTLTREKIEEYGRNLSAGQFHTTATFLLAHDAAQRQALTQQAQEVERLKKDAEGQAVRIDALRKYLAQAITEHHNAEIKLAAMTTERDNWETSADEATQELVAVRQQLTASEQEAARVRQFVEWASTADAGVWAFQIREQAQKALKGDAIPATGLRQEEA